ncbi:MAG: hypothetical protein CVT69_00175 [Actinobacteria bacterium HGW-Actinobacteria-9]|nr:MAG: hypothetical protein CVT69_00175 [Actinobacteria bacterium HGW-Actinobacteria-9]
MNRRTRQILIGAVAVAVAVGGLWLLAGDRTQDTGTSTAESGRGDTDVRVVDPEAESGVDRGAGGSQPLSSAEESVGVISDAPAKPGDRVSNEIAYELVDTLKAAGIEPVAGEPLTLEYVDRLDRVRVSGRFESREETSFVLEFDDGAWKVDE